MATGLFELQRTAGNRVVLAMLGQRTSPTTTVAGAPADVAFLDEESGPDHAEGFVSPPADAEDVEAYTTDVDTEQGTASRATPGSSAGIGQPTAVSWAALDPSADGARAIPGPSVATLPAIQAAAGGGTGVVGWTSFPLGTAKAPQFDFGSTSSTPGGMGPPSWTCAPTWKQHFYEGDSVCMYLAAGRHKTAIVEGGKPVYFNLSAAISARDSAAEAEHANDIKRARDISIKEAEDVLANHVIGKAFPAAGTKAEAEQKVLDRITSKLTHAGLGNDQTKWAATYQTLYRKTLGRDNKGWHTFGLTNRRVNPAGDVDYDLSNGTTSINVTSSAALIVY